MTLTLELPPSAIEALASDARRRGTTPEQLSADDLLEKYARIIASPSQGPPGQNRHERVRQLLHWARTLPAGAPLS